MEIIYIRDIFILLDLDFWSQIIVCGFLLSLDEFTLFILRNLIWLLCLNIVVFRRVWDSINSFPLYKNFFFRAIELRVFLRSYNYLSRKFLNFWESLIFLSLRKLSNHLGLLFLFLYLYSNLWGWFHHLGLLIDYWEVVLRIYIDIILCFEHLSQPHKVINIVIGAPSSLIDCQTFSVYLSYRAIDLGVTLFHHLKSLYEITLQQEPWLLIIFIEGLKLACTY